MSEVDDLRALVAQLIARVEEQDALIAELRAENTALRAEVAELRRRLGQNPRNSHRPPSSEGLGKPPPRSRREQTDRRSGGQPGHEGRTLRQVECPDEVVTHAPARCGCGRSLARARVVSTERRQVIEIEVRRRVVEHVIEHRECPCGHATMGPVPPGVGGPVQYGPGVRGFAVYLMVGQHLPLGRTAELLTEVCGISVSQGTLARWYEAAAAGLTTFDAELAALLAQAPVVGADETGLRVDAALRWVHVARTDALTRYTVHERRGFEAIRAAAILDNLDPNAVLVHDFWAPYFGLPVIHAVCGAHLGRELVAAAETPGQTAWATGMDRLLREINRTTIRVRDHGADALSPRLIGVYRQRYDTLIRAGWAANPEHRSRTSRRGKRPPHVNLLDRLDAHRDDVLRYVTDLRVPFTNNGSEQDIRPLKIRAKISGGLRTTHGAEAFCQLRSYLSTARKHGHSAFTVIRELANGDPWLPGTELGTS